MAEAWFDRPRVGWEETQRSPVTLLVGTPKPDPGEPAVRYFFTVVALLLVIGGLVAIKGSQLASLMAFGEQAQAAGIPPEPVGTAIATKAPLEGILTAVGSVTSAQRVAVSTEVPGVVTEVRFESGAKVTAGDVLVRLDTKVERAQLSQALASRQLAEVTAQRSRTLFARGALSTQQQDTDDSQLKSASAQVEMLRAQIALKTIRAPFSGTLGIRQVNLGQYLSPGTSVAELETETSRFVDFSLPQQRASEIREGMPLRVRLSDASGSILEGTIAVIEAAVDASTRQLQLRGSVPDPAGTLRPGMFVEVEVVLAAGEPTVVVPTTAVVHASYGNSVFVVGDRDPDEPGMRTTPDGKTVRTARQHFVKTGSQRGDFTAILAGIEDGAEVVVAGAFKLRNGAPIVVDNSVLPTPSMTPDVVNR